MRFARDIRLRRVICLRARVDLYHITLRHRRKISLSRRDNITAVADGNITQIFRGFESICKKR